MSRIEISCDFCGTVKERLQIIGIVEWCLVSPAAHTWINNPVPLGEKVRRSEARPWGNTPECIVQKLISRCFLRGTIVSQVSKPSQSRLIIDVATEIMVERKFWTCAVNTPAHLIPHSKSYKRPWE
ncbi:hypothetical protein TNIN_363191 [Trichonephila inaurata madagascariensis]|uniref:Uncharacterized protein n=1 Tax=Trichonephila inaurata madagascariensis TaxID=2747483 RepID=A0A8X6XSM2_9ARAC|nr:hypothetical protein TNIN_363191 [Trichonephila inaurata madagascariensis]